MRIAQILFFIVCTLVDVSYHVAVVYLMTIYSIRLLVKLHHKVDCIDDNASSV